MALHPPSESQILHSYLLHPSPLPTILPYTTFLSLLAKSSSVHNTHAIDLRRLYRDLQFQRDVTIDDVRRRIENECARSVALTARLSRQVRQEEGSSHAKKRKRNDGVDDDISVDDNLSEQKETTFDTAMHDGVPLSNTIPAKTSKHNHSMTSLLPVMEHALNDLSSEIEDLETAIETLRKEAEEKVGGLSDLRYGKFTSGRLSGNTTGGSAGEAGVEDEVVAALRELKARIETESR